MAGIPRNQHVVSQMVSGRWTIDGALVVDDLIAGRSWETSTRGFGAIRDFVASDPVAAEAYWQVIEGPGATALAAVDEGTILDRQGHIDALIDLVALHYVRSEVATRLWTTSTATSIAGARTIDDYEPGALERVVLQELGRPAQGDDDLLWAANLIADAVEAELRTRESFRDLVYSSLEKATVRLRRAKVHIAAVVGDVELVIGDVPVVPVDSETDRVGIAAGVAIENSDAFFMPLGPRVLVAFAEGPGARHELLVVDAAAADRLNTLQIRNAHRQIAGRTSDAVRRAVELSGRGAPPS